MCVTGPGSRGRRGRGRRDKNGFSDVAHVIPSCLLSRPICRTAEAQKGTCPALKEIQSNKFMWRTCFELYGYRDPCYDRSCAHSYSLLQIYLQMVISQFTEALLHSLLHRLAGALATLYLSFSTRLTFRVFKAQYSLLLQL